MIKNFKIQNTKLKINTNNFFKNKFQVKSFPRSYDVEFINNSKKFNKFLNSSESVILIDANIYKKYYSKKIIKNKKLIKIDAKEKNKNLNTTNQILDFFVKHNVSKSNKIIAIGGGIIQDLAGYASLVYKRGLHWEYVPTTFLGMTDSCVGGKVGINYGEAKNLAGLFSAPRKVLIDINFLESLPKGDLLSGLGEALRLHLTGGMYFVEKFQQNIDGALKFKKKNLINIIKNSLLVKRAVVEEDEYEFDIRRSMNFGHSYGHAIEILCKHSLPHGTAISIGMCVESILCSKKFKINKEIYKLILDLASKLITKRDYKIIKSLKFNKLNDVMLKDKKTLNGIIKLTVPKKIGNIKFFNQKLDKQNINEIIEANTIFLNSFNERKYSN